MMQNLHIQGCKEGGGNAPDKDYHDIGSAAMHSSLCPGPLFQLLPNPTFS